MTSRVTRALRLTIPLLSLAGFATAQNATPPQYSYENADLESVVVDASADTSVLQLAATRNYGTSRSLDANRALISVSEAAFRSAVGTSDYVASAKLRLTLKSSLLPKLPRTLTAHRVLKAWTESGATWNCAIDSNTSNFSNDCSGATDWSMTSGDAFVSQASGSTVLPTFRYGTIEIDVTADVRAYNNNAPFNGWLLKADGLDLTALDDFQSRETSTPPQLIMQVRHCNATLCSDSNNCSADTCDAEGFCTNTFLPNGTACDDGNICTVGDKCLGGGCADYTSRLPSGTTCGPDGLICDGLGDCVLPPPD